MSQIKAGETPFGELFEFLGFNSEEEFFQRQSSSLSDFATTSKSNPTTLKR
ncbi:MAG: hypothetical protein GW898_11685 [Thiomicrospira sp.]|nr:hypothetical protein [Thiomicrospira sp.]NCN68064.1 hypothetical protein [Thiomicrospira sp.]NCO15010.1 hypothetical protein [Thiomicrospira sp.]NCO82663.1 hypothetical protein [Thiomicrospira sp.]NCS64502.1 hypothetical protein [Thiomicrospira sp.]